MPDFLIHRDTEGGIVLAIPYANIMMMDIALPDQFNAESLHPTLNHRVGITLQTDKWTHFWAIGVDADRYLSEWREWWEGKANPLLQVGPLDIPGRVTRSVTQLLVCDECGSAIDGGSVAHYHSACLSAMCGRCQS